MRDIMDWPTDFGGVSCVNVVRSSILSLCNLFRGIPLATSYKLMKVRGSNRYRIAFKPKLLSAFLDRDAEAFALALAKLRVDLNALGRSTFLDPDNQAVFDVAVNAEPSGMWVSRFHGVDSQVYRIMRCFTDGYMQDSSPDFETSFDVVVKFYALLDTAI